MKTIQSGVLMAENTEFAKLIILVFTYSILHGLNPPSFRPREDL
jgi:hypothetical protein